MTSKVDQRSFNVEMSGREPSKCNHGWVNKREICVFCGAKVCSSCGGEGEVYFEYYDDEGQRRRGADQCPNPKCDRGFVA